jgi:hypothetical protein
MSDIVWVILIVAILVIAYFLIARCGSAKLASEPMSNTDNSNYNSIIGTNNGSNYTSPNGSDVLSSNSVEGLSRSDLPYNWTPETSQYWMNPRDGIKPFRIDTDRCSPKCCGQSWPTPFEGLSPEQIRQRISSPENPGPFVTTDYTCSNGPGGVGCPCVNEDQYLFIGNHGTMPDFPQEIEPSFLIPGDLNQNYSYLGHAEGSMENARQNLAGAKGSYSRYRRMNDLTQQRAPVSPATMSNLSGVGPVVRSSPGPSMTAIMSPVASSGPATR